MAQLDETDVTLENTAGRDVHVIDKKVPVELNGTDKFVNVGVWFLFIIGGVVYTVKKNHARSYFKQLEQKIQHDASTIDNYMAQRVSILQNTAKLLDKAIALDKETFVDVAKARAGSSTDKDAARNELQGKLDMAQNSIDVVLERYPDLKAHQEIQDALQQNSYLQQEITAAREVYNNAVAKWNSEIFTLWAKKYVAAKEGYTTRIPFIASKEIKEKAEGVFF
jgi:LemA protein